MPFNPTSPTTLLNAKFSRNSTHKPTLNEAIKFDPKADLLELNKLLNLVNWLQDHTLQLPLQLAIALKKYIQAQLEHYHSVEDSLQDSSVLKECDTAFQKLTSDLPSIPMAHTVWVPTPWATQTAQYSTPLYTAFNVQAQHTHNIEYEKEILACTALNAKNMAFNILQQKKETKTPNSILPLAHLLIAHIDTYPGSIITLSEKTCSYHKELSEYLYAYQELYRQIKEPISFTLRWSNEKPISEPKKSDINGKIKEIMKDSPLSNFEKLQFELPVIEEALERNSGPRP